MKLRFEKREKFSGRRIGEKTLGESGLWLSSEKDWQDFLENHHVRFCILGIPEDIGVRANFGRPGAWSAFEPALQTLCNLPSNPFFPSSVCALGASVFTEDLMIESNGKDNVEFLRQLTRELDKRVEYVLDLLFKYDKIPIIIGGGHNNALPILRALDKNTSESITVINIDAHADLRNPSEGHHSGNSFSIAMQENILDQYLILGYHENYLSDFSWQWMQQYIHRVKAFSFEDLFVRCRIPPVKLKERVVTWGNKTGVCGLELDMDAIIHAPSSARTSSGLLPETVREWIFFWSKELKPSYFHIAEAAPVLAHRKADNRTGKLISYLITDFVKGRMECDS